MPRNNKVVIMSLLALVFVYLMFVVHWSFVVPILAIIYFNQKELMGGK